MIYLSHFQKKMAVFFKLLITFLLCVLTFVYPSTTKAETIHFKLFDQNGPVTEQSYPGKFLLFSIGYTSCPDICPTTLYEYAYAMKQLKHADRIQPIFLTIDPVTDEINRLNAYTDYFDERIVGLSGEIKNIETLTKQLGATFGYRLNGQRIDNPEPGMGYTVYHSAMIYLISPERELIDVLDYQVGGDDLVNIIDEHIAAAQ